jgi:hypothetical protein
MNFVLLCLVNIIWLCCLYISNLSSQNLNVNLTGSLMLASVALVEGPFELALDYTSILLDIEL